MGACSAVQGPNQLWKQAGNGRRGQQWFATGNMLKMELVKADSAGTKSGWKICPI